MSPASAASARRRTTGAVLGAVLVVVTAVAVPGAASALSAPAAHTRSESAAVSGWRWPVDGFRIVRQYVAPPHRYGAGHRGIDLRPVDEVVRAPEAGVIAFAGDVAGRGVVTIDHGDGLVTTLEPVTAEVPVGAAVRTGDVIGTLSAGGYAAAGTLHFGVRRDGEYINPLVLLGGVPRAVLLPCC